MARYDPSNLVQRRAGLLNNNCFSSQKPSASVRSDKHIFPTWPVDDVGSDSDILINCSQDPGEVRENEGSNDRKGNARESVRDDGEIVVPR